MLKHEMYNWNKLTNKDNPILLPDLWNLFYKSPHCKPHKKPKSTPWGNLQILTQNDNNHNSQQKPLNFKEKNIYFPKTTVSTY